MENEEKKETAAGAPLEKKADKGWPEDEPAKKYLKEAGSIEDLPTADEQAAAEEAMKPRK